MKFLLFVLISFSASNSAELEYQNGRRQVWAWASGSHNVEAQLAQLRNSTWAKLIDGIQVWCGCSFISDGIALNTTTWTQCLPLVRTAQRNNVKFQLIVSGSVPPAAIEDPDKFVKDAIEIHRFTGVDGFSLDDERDCAPRATTEELEGWMSFHTALAQGLENYKRSLRLTSAIQAVFGIQSNNPDNEPCQKKPAEYPLDERVVQLFQTTTGVQKWLVMDTYYFNTGRFLTTLDWHATYIPKDKLAIGLQNRTDLSTDDLVARFYAIERHQVDWINIFMMPVADQFLPHLQRYKSYCLACGKQIILGCYDMDIECHPSDESDMERK